LAHRIRALSDKGELPPGLAQATDLLRLIGNVAAHGSEKSIGPIYIGAIDDFFIAILEYLYVAPEKIADFQKRLAVLSGPTISDVAEMLRLLRILQTGRSSTSTRPMTRTVPGALLKLTPICARLVSLLGLMRELRQAYWTPRTTPTAKAIRWNGPTCRSDMALIAALGFFQRVL
jgi:hypothetical protein